MRTIKQIQEKQTTTHGGHESYARVTAQIVNKLEIEKYGTTTNQNFIQTLVSNNRLPYTALKNKLMAITNEYAQKLFNDNEDLFPAQF